MAEFRKFLFVLVSLIYCKLSQQVPVEIIGSCPESGFAVIVGQVEDDVLSLNSESSYRYTSIKFINSKFEQIPANIISKFPNLTSLDISNCGIRTIHRDDFKDLVQCENLTLSENQAYQLEEDVFTHLPNLRTLSLTNMSLTELKPGLFKRQNKVTILELQNNAIRSISSDILEPLENLQYINLRNNRISVLPNKLFIFNQNLHTIDLAFNSINKIENDTFLNTTPNLSNLILQNNQFAYLLAPKCTTLLAHSGSLNQLELMGPISFLSLGSNQLEAIPNIDFSAVIFLDISNNLINSMPSLKNATKLEKLYLSGNRIIPLPANSFEGLTSLQKLHLANMQLTSAMVHNKTMFDDLQNLKILDLSGNLFNVIKFSYFRHLPKLEKIFLGATTN